MRSGSTEEFAQLPVKQLEDAPWSLSPDLELFWHLILRLVIWK